ncbi:hypothetical protein L7F22_046726 [Adiantum nelumboides]|nr:hypothetical protein [Adiantum nelumboides]
MWASRALFVRRLSVFSSSSWSASWQAISPAFLCSPSTSSKAHCLLQQRCVVYNKISKNKLLLNKTRDSSYENFMDDEKKMLIMKRIIKLLLKQTGQKMLYRYMLRRGGYVGLVKPQRIGDIMDKYPRIIRVYRNPNELDVWVTLAKPILELLEEEKMLKEQRAQLAAERLRKVLMMSSTRRIRIDRINYLKEELGLPDNFKRTVVQANPHLFKLVITRSNLAKGVAPSVKLLVWDEKLAVPAIEAYRQDPASTSGLDEEGKKKKAYSFPINLPPNFKIKKAFRVKLRKWQELPYRSPYADPTDLDLQSEEAFKRAVAVIHEFLHITTEKRTKISHLAHLREDYKLPQKLGATVLQNPGIFYMSTKSNTQTIFLREGYKKGVLLEKDQLFSIKEKFLALIKLGRESTKKLPKQGPYKFSDSDTSDEEGMEILNRIEVGKVEKVEGLEEGSSGGDKEEVEAEENDEDGNTTCNLDDDVGQESSFSDDEVGQESIFSDDEDDSCLSGVENEHKEDPDPISKMYENLSDEDEKEALLNMNGSDKDENEGTFAENEMATIKDAFETEDDSEQDSSQGRKGYQEASHSFVQISKEPRRRTNRRRARW